MSFDMRPHTEPGARLLAAIRDVAPLLSERAEAADRNNQLCEQNYHDIQAAGIAGAFVPDELGGMGLQSMHDWILAVCALARADGSTAIAMNMHFSANTPVPRRASRAVYAAVFTSRRQRVCGSRGTRSLPATVTRVGAALI